MSDDVLKQAEEVALNRDVANDLVGGYLAQKMAAGAIRRCLRCDDDVWSNAQPRPASGLCTDCARSA